MMLCKLKLIRYYFCEEYTIGRLYINDTAFCDTVEDKYRDLEKESKVYSKTAIPCGSYKVILNISRRFNRLLPLLLGVRHFEGIRIHSGNSAADSSGCIIVGTIKCISKGWLSNSRATERLLVETLKQYNSFCIEVINEPSEDSPIKEW